MEVKLDSLMAFEKVKSDPDAVFSLVDRNNMVVLLKDNQPVYIIMKYTALDDSNMPASQETAGLKLHEAMRLVLLDADEHTMHAAALADEIYNRKLYLQKNGGKAQYNQIRARCSHYPDMFEALPGNIIRLKENAR